MKTVKETVQALGEAFQEFKSVQAQRLEEIETKGVADPILNEKLDKVSSFLNETSERLAKLEAVNNRPRSESSQGSAFDNPEHKSAFAGYVRRGDEATLQGLELKSLSVGSDPDGGYLIPAATVEMIQTKMEDMSVLRRLAKTTKISTDALELLIDRKEADAGWVAETGERAETNTPDLSKLRIPVHEMFAKPHATQKLLDDSNVNIESWLSEKIAHKMAAMEAEAFLFGDGAGKPRGILNYDTSENEEWGCIHTLAGAPTNVDALIQGLHALKPGYLPNAKWLMSRHALSRIRTLKDQQGQYLWQPGLEGDYRPKLLGHTIELCDSLVLEEDNDTILFGDFASAYQIVDRAGIHILRDPYSVKPFVQFYTTKRVGGDMANFEAVKAIKIANNQE
jgi:HK97 family phage major capsid protein